MARYMLLRLLCHYSLYRRLPAQRLPMSYFRKKTSLNSSIGDWAPLDVVGGGGAVVVVVVVVAAEKKEEDDDDPVPAIT